MQQEKLDRINHLARKARSEGLTEEEKGEQKALRAQYVKDFRAGLEQRLDNTFILTPDGAKTKLKKKGG